MNPNKKQKFTEISISLDDIRNSLMRQEESIIFSLIERAQFSTNTIVYKSGNDSLIHDEAVNLQLKENEKDLSFMQYFLLQTEILHAKLGRYVSQEEHPFCKKYDLSIEPAIKREIKNSGIKPNSINLNDKIYNEYVNKIIPVLCTNGNDLHYGSTSVADITALQALSRRVHYGKYVAESKFQKNREQFTELIKNKDTKGIMKLLTNVEVEKKVINRVLLKASRYAKENDNNSIYKVDPKIVAKLYEEVLIPLNKDVQVEYLLNRLDE